MASENTSVMAQLCHLLIQVRRNLILDQLLRSQTQNRSQINDGQRQNRYHFQGQDYSQISDFQVGGDHDEVTSVCQEVKSKKYNIDSIF